MWTLFLKFVNFFQITIFLKRMIFFKSMDYLLNPQLFFQICNFMSKSMKFPRIHILSKSMNFLKNLTFFHAHDLKKYELLQNSWCFLKFMIFFSKFWTFTYTRFFIFMDCFQPHAFKNDLFSNLQFWSNYFSKVNWSTVNCPRFTCQYDWCS